MEKNILSKNLRGIILVYGIPGSGKSYFSKQLIKNLTINANLNLFYLEIDVLEIFSSKFQLDDQFLNKFEIKMEEFQSSMHNCLNKIFHISKKIEKDDVTISGGKDFKEFEFNGKEVESYFFNNKTWKTARDLALKITEKLISYYSELQKNFIIVVDDNFILKSMRKKYYQLCNKFKLGYTEILLDVPLEKALFQNNQREKFKQIPEFIIKNCYNKIERNFTNGIDFKEESDIINVVSQALNILQESVFIKNEYQENKLKDEKNFFHLLDLLFREEIGKINKIYSSEWDDRKKKSNNKLMAEFKKVYIDLIKFILFHQNHPDYDKSKEEKKKSFELISKNSQLNFQFTEKIILQIFDENHSKITNDLTKIAEIFSNSFSEFSLFLFKK